MTVSSKRCAICGLVNSLDVVACRRCNANQWAPAAEIAAAQAPLPAVGSAPRASSVTGKQFLVVVGAAVVAVVVLVAAALHDKDQRSPYPPGYGPAPTRVDPARARRDYANAVNNTLRASGDDITIWTEGADDDVLVFSGSGVDTRLLTPETRQMIRTHGFRTVRLLNANGQRWEIDP